MIWIASCIAYLSLYLFLQCLLISHTVNLLTNMPRESYEELLTPLTEGAIGGHANKDLEYDGNNMEAVNVLLDFLDKRLDTVSVSIDRSFKFN